MKKTTLLILIGCLQFCFSGMAQSLTTFSVDSLEYSVDKDSIRYGVTLTIPSGKGPFPAVILITGSGQQDRDETIFQYKPFAAIATYLSEQGYLVMRVDDRGIGRSTGNFKLSTTTDFAKDVANHIHYLQQRTDVRKNKIGLLGHSEGGLIAEMLAAERRDLAFVILLAAPGIPIAQLMAEQNEALLRSGGIDSTAATSYAAFFSGTMPKLAAAPDTTTARRLLMAALDEWRSREHPNRVMATTGIHDEASLNRYLQVAVQQFSSPWLKQFILLDPQPYLRKIKTKVLALNGSRDIQVLPKSNLEGIRKSLEASKAAKFSIFEVPNLNHLFRECKTCTIQEYAVSKEPFSPAALAIIGDWLHREIQ
jgi:pimeloyl-ACP methyl ester carboxylesterase